MKELNKMVPYARFKVEGLFLLKEMLLPVDFMCKIDLKYEYFAVPLSKKLPDICQIPMERPIIRIIFMSMLQTFFRIKSFYQINESSNIFAAETLYKNYNISR